MTTELFFLDRKIPVSFISSDQKAIPRLIRVLENTQAQPVTSVPAYFRHIERIEIIGNNAVLHSSKTPDIIQLPLY